VVNLPKHFHFKSALITSGQADPESRSAGSGMSRHRKRFHMTLLHSGSFGSVWVCPRSTFPGNGEATAVDVPVRELTYTAAR
jgi:hypothetical protein